MVPEQAPRTAATGCRRVQDRLRRADPDRRRVARRLRPGPHAQLLHLPLQPGGLRGAPRGARRGRGRRVRPLGHRRAASSSRCTGAATATSTYASMAETLRGGLSLGLSAGSGSGATTSAASKGRRRPTSSSAGSRSACSRQPQPAARQRLVPRALGVRRRGGRRHCACFTRLKIRLMPYLCRAPWQAARARHPGDARHGAGVPRRPGLRGVDPQYMLGPDLLVAPVFRDDGRVDVYVPDGTWTDYLDGTTLTGPRWVRRAPTRGVAPGARPPRRRRAAR